MKNVFTLLLSVTSLAASAQATFTDSATATLQTPSGTAQVVFKMALPPMAQPPLQGVLLFAVQNTGASARTEALLNADMQNLAAQARLALVQVKSRAPGNAGLAGFSPLRGNEALLTDALQTLATASAHPEVANAPILAAGFGDAADFALGLGYMLPARVAAMALVRPLGLAAPAWAGVAPYANNRITEIPNLVLTGEVSGPDVNGNMAAYLATALKTQVLQRRAANERIQLAVEMNASQSTLKAKSLAYLASFFSKAAQLRIPANSNATAGPVTLNTVSENSGYLTQAAQTNVFRQANYSSAAFGGSLPAAQSNWLPDQASAQAWTAFHVSAFDSAIFFPSPYQFIPYCSGARPSPISARWRVQPGLTFDSNNVFRIEASDIRGNFDNERYPARSFGNVKSTRLNDSILSVLVPDNFQFMNAAPASTPNRYRLRLVATSPYTESYNSGEILYWRLCPVAPPRLYASGLTPLKNMYAWGNTVQFMLYKTALAQVAPTAYIRIVLSDSTGAFKGTTRTTFIDSVPASFVGDSLLVRVRLPQARPGLRYRLRGQIHGDVFMAGTSNGHDIALSATITAISPRRSVTDWMSSTPNPARGTACLQWAYPLARPAQVEVVDMQGRVMLRHPVAAHAEGLQLSLPTLKGVFLIRLSDGARHYLKNIIVE